MLFRGKPKYFLPHPLVWRFFRGILKSLAFPAPHQLRSGKSACSANHVFLWLWRFRFTKVFQICVRACLVVVEPVEIQVTFLVLAKALSSCNNLVSWLSSLSRHLWRRVLHKACQQSVQLTCGSLRDLQAFFWLRVFSTSHAESTPAHPPLTQTVGKNLH